VRVLLALLVIAGAARADEWRCARGDAGNSGVTKNRGPVQTPQVAWQREEKEAISRGLALASGKLVYGVGEYVVACRRQADGREVWDGQIKQQISAWPAILGERVYVGSPDRVHYVLKMEDGKEAGGAEAGAGILADPVVTEEYYLAGATDGFFYVMAPANAAVAWKPKTGPVRHGCAFDRGTAYVVNEEGTLHALDLRRRQERWRYEAQARPLCAPILGKGGAVWLVLADAVQEVTKKGTAGARREVKGIAGVPALDGALLHYGTDAGEVVVLDLARGRELKRVKVADEAVHAPLVLAKGVLYGAAGATLFAADPKSGKLLWTFAGEERFQPPIVADKSVYVAAGRTLFCLR